MKRIYLTDNERTLLFNKAKELEETEPPMFQAEFWRKAQLALPIDRRRMDMANGPRSQLNSNYKKWKEKHPNGAPQKSAAEAQPAKPETNGVPPAEPQFIFIEKPARIEPDYGKISTVTLARILLERLSMYEAVTQKIDTLADILKAKQQVDQRYVPDLDLQKLVRPPEPEKAIRVAVIGCLPEQEQEIEKIVPNLPKKVELRFMRKDAANNIIGPSVQYAICTRFIRHGMWDQARQALGTDRVLFADTPVNGVVQKLYDICARQ